jgi:hypothetical protein
MSCEVIAQSPAAKPDAEKVEHSFKGVVVSLNPVGLIVKGEFTLPADKPEAGPRGKSAAQTVPFMIKGAKITRCGWRPCEPKSLEKGMPVCVTFAAPSQGRGKLVATRIEVGGELSTADKEPILAKVGKVLFDDDFSRSEMMPKCRPGKGFWEVNDGVVKAAENPDDKHAATVSLQPNFPYKDIVAEFSFKFEGSTGCSVSMDDGNYKESHAGHICRAGITPTSVSLGDSKFGSMKNEIHDKMKDPQTTEDEKKQLMASIKDKSAAFKIALDPAAWHQARVEVVGDEMLVSIDYQPVGYFKSEGINHPTKSRIGIQVSGKSLLLDNVKVWEAALHDDWAKNRETVQAATRKP